MTQRQKFGFFLTALVVIPIFIMGLVGLNTIKSQLTTYQLSAQQNAANELNRLNNEITQNFSELIRSLRKDVEQANKLGQTALSCIFKTQCRQGGDERMDIVISYDTNGIQIFPPEDAIGQLYSEKEALKNISSAQITAMERLQQWPLLERAKGTWSSYLTPKGHHLVYCWQNKETFTFCASLNRQWIIKIVINSLNKQITPSTKRHIQLTNVRNQIIWQNKEQALQTLLARKQLASPFYFWSLKVSEKTEQSAKNYTITIIALILPLAALLITLAMMLFRTQKQALEEADNRIAFATSVSHELRTPLTNLQLYIDLIMTNISKQSHNKDQSKDLTDITKYTKVISAETTRLTELVNNALTVAKGKNPSERIKVKANPDHIITETVSRLSPLLEDTKDHIIYNLDASKDVMIDRSALEQILVNLIDNARKYANGHRIRIKSKLSQNQLTFSVRDWGSDFKSSKIANLFSPYFRRSNQQTSKISQDGFGLGLTVCKQLAEANNGTITCEAANPGARFIVTMEINSKTYN